jgi:predicted transposase YbfD/YdcC
VRSHWAIENKLHWVLDTTSKEDQSHLRVGHGAKNMAVVRHFALNRQASDRRSSSDAANVPHDPQCMLESLGPMRR